MQVNYYRNIVEIDLAATSCIDRLGFAMFSAVNYFIGKGMTPTRVDYCHGVNDNFEVSLVGGSIFGKDPLITPEIHTLGLLHQQGKLKDESSSLSIPPKSQGYTLPLMPGLSIADVAYGIADMLIESMIYKAVNLQFHVTLTGVTIAAEGLNKNHWHRISDLGQAAYDPTKTIKESIP